MRVPDHHTGGGDPAHTLRLLWRRTEDGPRRGPRQGRSLDDIVRAAIELADREGLDAVTMRALAKAVGVAPMTLYTYVPGKAELLDLMLDALYADMPRPDRSGEPWRTRVAALAQDNRELFAAHPWAAEVATGRPPLGPGLMAKYEYELRAFDDTGLDDVTRDAALTFVLDFVRAAARSAAEARSARQASAWTDEQWWTANAPLLAEVLDERRYPTAVRVGAAAGAAHNAAYHPDHAYTFGLTRVLDALTTLVNPPPPPTHPSP
ncbi:TetR/AcrR family transcriptional regulator C-terminal domain-containing protein [Micromonospora fiedleri]|uniref:TetR/AcrR family transcriptional regulator C-terminal domain-containing protein n=1 Tax=Micromonospora fiedleri TaxID=1157498 RepID=A0ABS1UMV0_9ACTN|nr:MULTISPECIES: TetR/AcrR family transcriptional regulator [Micromonospora]MBL6277681.1 TetR/AcrR family transcriptional regulator C-terminal domain-containing protein [Micromonospora fiedleri]WSK45743.1 TetR/AcrR family transcriptional regulator [Micromonospora maris]